MPVLILAILHCGQFQEPNVQYGDEVKEAE